MCVHKWRLIAHACANCETYSTSPTPSANLNLSNFNETKSPELILNVPISRRLDGRQIRR